MEKLIASDVIIEDGTTIDVSEYLEIGEGSIIRRNCIIEGRCVKLGKRFYMDLYGHIGGGSCFDVHSELVIGDNCHVGRFSHINAARPLRIGNEVGFNARIYTHGAYLPEDMGFPVQFAPVTIGNRVWMPEATVLPGTVIEDNVVVTAKSLVRGHLKGGCLYGGVPIKLLKENCFPRELSEEEVKEIHDRITREAREIYEHKIEMGKDVEWEAILDNQFRRHGIKLWL